MLRAKDKRLSLGRQVLDIGRAPIGVLYDPAGAFATAGATPNTKTAWADFPSATFDADGFVITISGGSGVGDFLIDIGLGSSGDSVDETILSNLLFSGALNFAAADSFYVPLRVKAGRRVAWRFQCSDASLSLLLNLYYVRGGSFRDRAKTRATTYGADTSDSGGTVVDSGAVASTKGAYVNLGAIARAHEYLLLCVGTRNNAARTQADHNFDVACGTDIWLPDAYVRQEPMADIFRPCVTGWEVAPMIPAANLQVRQSSSITDATDRLADVVVIGFD